MAKKQKKFADDGWAVWVDGDDVSTVYMNDWLNPKGKSYIDFAIRIRGIRASKGLHVYVPFPVTREEIEAERAMQADIFSDGYLETVCLYRKLALEMLKHNVFIMHASVIEVDGEGTYAKLIHGVELVLKILNVGLLPLDILAWVYCPHEVHAVAVTSLYKLLDLCRLICGILLAPVG